MGEYGCVWCSVDLGCACREMNNKLLHLPRIIAIVHRAKCNVGAATMVHGKRAVVTL